MWAAGGGRARGAAGRASIHRRRWGRVRAPSQKAKATRLTFVCGEANIKSTAGCSNSLAGESDVPGNEAINLVPVLRSGTRCSAASGIQLPCAEWGLLLSASEKATLGSPPSPITLTSLLSELAARSSEAAGTSLLSLSLGSARRVPVVACALPLHRGGAAARPSPPLPSRATSSPGRSCSRGPGPRLRGRAPLRPQRGAPA